MSPRRARRLPADVPRRPRRSGRTPPGTSGASDTAEDLAGRLGPEQTQDWPDGEWVVRPVPGEAATKPYRCPGCDQQISQGTAHVVVWSAHTPGLAARRHWHSSCWQRRPRRPGPTRY